MKRTIFDRIFLGLLFIIIGLFAFLLLFTTYATTRTLISQKQNSLMNEANLITQQTIRGYISGIYTEDYMTVRFNELEEYLNIKIWYADKNGNLVTVSNREQYEHLPNNIFDLDSKEKIGTTFSSNGRFYGTFDENTISVGVPIYSDSELQGYVLIHTPINEINTIQTNVFTITYMPFLVIVLLTFITLAFLSQKVLRPMAKINATAREYAAGNFDAKTNIVRNDEIGELANSLEYMASELSKLDEYRKNFISNISHDFRSPLTSIKGYLEAMLDGTIPPDKYDKYLNIVLSESKRLTKLTTGLLELNDFDNYGPILKTSSFDLLDIFNSVTLTFEKVANDKHITFDISNSASTSIVVADKTKITQVIYNLVDNALKFSSANSTIYISLSEKNDKLFVSVKDQGTGIKKESQNKVWERFYKTDPSRGKDKQGTGLGLSITKEIIKAHGENINLLSTEGVGSEFIFSLSKAKNN